MSSREWLRSLMLICLTAILTASFCANSYPQPDPEPQRRGILERIVRVILDRWLDRTFQHTYSVVENQEPKNQDTIDFTHGW